MWADTVLICFYQRVYTVVVIVTVVVAVAVVVIVKVPALVNTMSSFSLKPN